MHVNQVPISYKIDELPAVAARVLGMLEADDSKGAVVVGLHGDLGAGKTTFSKEVGKQLGVMETITSPTFVIQKTYATSSSRFARFVHIDAYRLEDASELEVLGFKRLLEEEKSLIFIEWPEKVADILPDSTIHIYISSSDEFSRVMKFNA